MVLDTVVLVRKNLAPTEAVTTGSEIVHLEKVVQAKIRTHLLDYVSFQRDGSRNQVKLDVLQTEAETAAIEEKIKKHAVQDGELIQ